MRHLVQISLTAIATLGFGTLMSSSALAADQNTYRPGHAYLKAAANSFEACEQQCNGDAQCRGWNFVQTRVRKPEFVSLMKEQRHLFAVPSVSAAR